MIRRLFHSLRAKARSARYEFFSKVVEPSDTALVLDIGVGSDRLPSVLSPDGMRVVVIDIDLDRLRRARKTRSEASLVVADGVHMPFADKSIGCVFCNSVIEHVDRPAEVASEITRVSRSYFVQTPSRSFPLEMHSFIPIPLYHEFPISLQRLLCKVFGASYEYISSVGYLSESELRSMFPDATLHKETLLGLTKSFYLYRSTRGDK